MIQKLPPINISRTKELAHDVYRYAYNNDSRIVTKLLEFYKEGINNPSVAKIIAKKSNYWRLQTLWRSNARRY